MTDKERLEEIKEKYMEHEYDFNLIKNDINWLIEQAERALKNAEDLEDMDRQLYSEQQQNKHYKQVLEFYADKKTYELSVKISMGTAFPCHEPIKYDKGEKARKALEKN